MRGTSLAVLASLSLTFSLTACSSSSNEVSAAKNLVTRGQANASAIFNTSYGVNLSGAEFGNVPGTFGTDYTYPSGSEAAYFAGAGLPLVRLPVKWERVQPSLGGALDPDNVARIKTFLNAAAASNSQVLVDIHNFGNYYGTAIGSGNVTTADFADLWSKLSAALQGTPGLAGYDIMNEPQGFATATAWPQAAQAAVNAIRKVDTGTAIYVEGDCWAGAHSWQSCNGSLNISDSANNLIYEAHQYFDADSSGTYRNSYDVEGAYPTVGADRLQPFVSWLKANNFRGYIGEYGVPNNDSRWLTVLDNAMTYMDQNCLSGTYWAAGPWWGGYSLSVEPNNGQDAEQMSILRKHTGVKSCSVAGVVVATPTPVPTPV